MVPAKQLVMKNNNMANTLAGDALVEQLADELNTSTSTNKRPSIFNKVDEYTRANDLRDADIYPYFKTLESSQEPEVRCDGRPMIMLSSNNYLD